MGCRLTSEVKYRRERTSALATNLSDITRNTRILCQKIRGNQSDISQSLKLRGKNKLQEGTDMKDEASSHRKVEAVFIAAASFQPF